MQKPGLGCGLCLESDYFLFSSVGSEGSVDPEDLSSEEKDKKDAKTGFGHAVLKWKIIIEWNDSSLIY